MLNIKCLNCYFYKQCIDYCGGDDHITEDKYLEAIRLQELDIVKADLGWHDDAEWWKDPQ